MAETKKNTPTLQDNIDTMNESVTITLFKDTGKYKDDIYVNVDGKSYQIQRGIPVKVPRKVARIINESIDQDRHTADRIDTLTSAYINKMNA